MGGHNGAHGVTRPAFRLRSGDLRDSCIINLRNVRMIHEGQRLALRFETGDGLPGVHTQLDDLERDTAADRLRLLGHVHDPTAALANLLKQLVAANTAASLFGEWDGEAHGRAWSLGPHRGPLRWVRRAFQEG